MKLTKAQAKLSRANPDVARLLEKVESYDGCWNWRSTKIGNYGSMMFRGRTWRAHRVSYTLFCGEIPEGLMVCHHSDNPRCVNPAHLFLGHATTNMMDMMRKGRAKNTITSKQDHLKNGLPSGEDASAAKLSAEDVKNILEDAVNGALTKDLCKQYQTCRYTIQAILRGETWKSIPRPHGLPRHTGRYERIGRQALKGGAE